MRQEFHADLIPIQTQHTQKIKHRQILVDLSIQMEHVSVNVFVGFGLHAVRTAFIVTTYNPNPCLFVWHRERE